MPNRKISILIVEDDSRVSRSIRDHLEKNFTNARVEIAGSPAKAHAICIQFPPTLIIWDGAPNERGTAEDYAKCIPDPLWPKVLPISKDQQLLDFAKSKGAFSPLPKTEDHLHAWCDTLVEKIKNVLPKGKKR